MQHAKKCLSQAASLVFRYRATPLFSGFPPQASVSHAFDVHRLSSAQILGVASAHTAAFQVIACPTRVQTELRPIARNLLHTRGLVSSPSVLQDKKQSEKDAYDSEVRVRREEYDEITDKIPLRPVSAPEAAGWSMLIAVAYLISGAILYTVVTQLFMETPEVAAFNTALDRVRQDPRIVVRLGESIKGYGSDARGKAARHRISHRIYTDSTGQEHVQVQFHIAGNGQRGIVSADMFKERGVWQYAYLYVDVEGRRLVLIEPQMRVAGSH